MYAETYRPETTSRATVTRERRIAERERDAERRIARRVKREWQGR